MQDRLTEVQTLSLEELKKRPREERFLNREFSWLAFNDRVLKQAEDRSVPLLERLRFLSIFSNNLDEFFMKRVGGLKRHIAVGMLAPSIDGRTPEQQLKTIRSIVVPQRKRAFSIYQEEIQPELAKNGIELLGWHELTAAEQIRATEYFRDQVFPVLTPLAVDSGHPFPFISNLSTSLAVALAAPDTNREEPLFARMKISDLEPRWLPVSSENGCQRFVSLPEVIIRNIGDYFPNMEILGCLPFRVTRNVDIEVDEEEADCLMELIEEELRQRRFARVVRLEHGPNPNPWILSFLLEELELKKEDVYETSRELDFTSFDAIANINIPELHFPTWTPAPPPALADEGSVFSIIRKHDVLVHHPFESFALSVERFIREAGEDPDVLSIKMTLYRVGDESPLMPLLIKAAMNGKHVVCLVELKARFEEERNIQWAHKLEEAGVHVVYGIPGLKIHAKTLLVVRQESDAVRSYCHISTGNYHSQTANLYTDLGLFTAKPKFSSEIVHFFNYLTGRSLKEDYSSLLISPINMEPRFLELIDEEIEHVKQGRPGHIVAKMNSLEDRHMIDKLYLASQAGVQIDLIVRGICCFRPGVPGLSENARVYSVIGRLLEHSRVYYFAAGSSEPVRGKFFIGSADWMGRNLHRRVEIMCPVEEPSDRQRIWEIFDLIFHDEQLVWEMQADGSYHRRTPKNGKSTDTHEILIKRTRPSEN